MTSLRRNIAALLFAVGLLLGIVVGVAVPLFLANPIESGDLTSAGVNNCATAMKASLVLLDPDSIVAFDAEEIAELRHLPERCDAPEVQAGLEAEYPALVERLQTIGT